MDCCEKKNESKGFWSGLIYGLIPHAGCIAFIVLTILGITTAASFLKPLLLNRYFFYILLALSFVFASLSAVIYLKRNTMLSFAGIKQKWKYLSILYSTAIGVNILLFLVIFPMAANISTAATGAAVYESLSNLTLKVDIPCPGHAPLISEELKKINGVNSIQFSFPNIFQVQYDSSVASKESIMRLDVFSTYKAEVLKTSEKDESPVAAGSCCGSCGAAKSGSSCGCREKI